MKENQLDSGYKTMEQPTISFKNRFEFLLNADIKVTRILCPCLWLSLHLPKIVCLFCFFFFSINFPCFPNNDYKSPTIHGIRLECLVSLRTLARSNSSFPCLLASLMTFTVTWCLQERRQKEFPTVSCRHGLWSLYPYLICHCNVFICYLNKIQLL